MGGRCGIPPTSTVEWAGGRGGCNRGHLSPSLEYLTGMQLVQPIIMSRLILARAASFPMKSPSNLPGEPVRGPLSQLVPRPFNTGSQH